LIFDKDVIDFLIKIKFEFW